MKAIMDLQQENTNLRKENADLETQIVNLRLKLKDDKTSDTKSIELEMKADIGRAAKFFHIFMSPTVTVDIFKVGKPQYAFDSPERYDANGQEMDAGIAAELHYSVPEKYLRYLGKHDSLAKEFLSSLSSGRSSALERFRKSAARVFNPPDDHNPSQHLDQALFATDYDKKRSANERIRELLGITVPGGNTFSQLPPILFARPNKTSTLFLNPSLFTLARLTIYGPTSLNQKDTEKLVMRANNTYFHPDTKQPPSATPGFISWMCMMACYMLSDDTEFNTSGIGNVTGTKYHNNYHLYKQTLIEGLATKSTHFSGLITTWNREVFPRSQVTEVIPDSQPTSFIGGRGRSRGNELSDHVRVADLLQQLSIEESDVEDGDEATENRSNPHNPISDHDDDDIFASDSDSPRTQVVPPESRSTFGPPTGIQWTPTEIIDTHEPMPDIVVDSIVNQSQHLRGSSTGVRKAASKQPPASTPVETVRRSSARNARSITTNVELPSLPSLPSDPITTNAQPPPPKAKRATRGAAKGKSKACGG